MSKKVEPYNLAPAFERALAYHAAHEPKFWGSLANKIEVDALKDDTVKLVLSTVRSVARDLGRGPSDPALVIQRLYRQMNEGKVSMAQVNSVLDLFIEMTHVPEMKDVAAEMAPILRRRVEADIVREAMATYAAHGNFGDLVPQINSSSKIGVIDTEVGLRMGKSALSQLRSVQRVERLPFGIHELDIHTNGGAPRRTEIVFVSLTGGGKSMMLVHVAGQALRCGYTVAYATLELGEEDILARVIANVTGIAISDIENEVVPDVVIEREWEKNSPGRIIIKEFPAKHTSMTDIRSWIAELAGGGEDPQVVIIDYCDKMVPEVRKRDGKTHEEAEMVYEDFRLFVRGTNRWGFTASQPQRKSDKGKKRLMGSEDLADSQGKARVCDGLFTLNADDDGIIYNCAKFRKGRAGWSVGPLPTAWECAQMVPL